LAESAQCWILPSFSAMLVHGRIFRPNLQYIKFSIGRISTPLISVHSYEHQMHWLSTINISANTRCYITIALKLFAKINNTTAFDMWMLQHSSKERRTFFFVVQQHLNDKHVFSCLSFSLFLPEWSKFGYVAASAQRLDWWI
jgi:hypothetical protein